MVVGEGSFSMTWRRESTTTSRLCVCAKKDLLVFYYENYLFEFFGLRREESCLWKGSHAESFMSFVPKIVSTQGKKVDAFSSALEYLYMACFTHKLLGFL